MGRNAPARLGAWCSTASCSSLVNTGVGILQVADACASAIAFQQQGVQTVRPLTHDLLRDVIGALGVRLEAVHITELRDDVFYAELRFSGGVTVSARPSDAIALALRCEVEILGADSVLDQAGIEIPDEQEDEVERFREFLDQISPEDFASGT